MTVTSLSLPLAYKQLFGYKKIKDNNKIEHKHKKTQPQQKNHWNERRQFVECVRSTFNAKYSSALPMRQTINRKLRSASIDLLLLAFAYEAKAMALNEGKQIKKKTKWIVERRAREPESQPCLGITTEVGFEVGVFISSTTFLYVSLILITLVWS